MVFGIEKCKTLSIAKGKLEMRNFTTEDDDTMRMTYIVTWAACNLNELSTHK